MAAYFPACITVVPAYAGVILAACLLIKSFISSSRVCGGDPEARGKRDNTFE